MADETFAGKVVVITGAASGIGRYTSLKMVALGASLALSDIDAHELQETAQLCAPKNPKYHFTCAFDVGSSKAVGEFVAEVVQKYGGIDHVFNCAGINPTNMSIESTTDEYWDKLMDTNLRGTFNVTRACIPHLKDEAAIVNVSSIVGIKPGPGTAVYAATKAGVIGFSKSMALELGPRNIRTNVIAPGYIHTPTNSSVVAGPDALKKATSKVAMGRMGTAKDVADVVAFLFSDASRYMNGSVVEINGGLE